jgi:hypothetical protein
MVDNQLTCIYLHAYVVHDWFHQFMLLPLLQIIDGSMNKNLIGSLWMFCKKNGGLFRDEIAQKLLSFVANETYVFQGVDGNVA